MAEQSFKSHAHAPIHTGVLWLMSLIALVLIVMQLLGYNTRDWATLVLVLAMFLVEQQGPIAVRKIYEEIEGKLK